VDHQRADWPRHKQNCISPDAEQGISAWAEFCVERESKNDNAELMEFVWKEREGVRDFIISHPFPSEERVRRYVREEAQFPIRGEEHFLKYPLAKRLWEAGSIESTLERLKEIRRVGLLLSKSLKQMQFHFYLIQHILCGGGIFPEVRETYGLPIPPVASYAKVIERAWDGVGPWRE
jgi:hypothetical protein